MLLPHRPDRSIASGRNTASPALREVRRVEPLASATSVPRSANPNPLKIRVFLRPPRAELATALVTLAAHDVDPGPSCPCDPLRSASATIPVRGVLRSRSTCESSDDPLRIALSTWIGLSCSHPSRLR